MGLDRIDEHMILQKYENDKNHNKWYYKCYITLT